MPMKIEGVEIFSVGKWNEDKFTLEDLHEMVKAFNENTTGARPYLKIGHDPKQVVGNALIGNSDGMPALGWVERLYVRGEKLVADFVDIPEKLYDLINKKGYRKVSSEIFFNIKIGEKSYKRMLAAVALLGAETPGVMNLQDILSSYSKMISFDATTTTIKAFETEFIPNSKENPNKGKRMPPGAEERTEAEIRAELENERLAKENAELATFKAKAEKEKADADRELAELKSFKAQAEKEKAELVAQAEVARVEKFVADLAAEKLVTPAMKPLVTALLGETKKEYTVKIENKDQKLSKEELLKETLKLFKAASDVNFDESSSVGDKKDQAAKEEALDKKAKDYAAKHNVGYGTALKAVMAEEC